MACIDQSLLAKVESWIALDPNTTTQLELKELVSNGNHQELTKRFQGRLAFGTAGLRGLMAAGPNCMNELIILQTAQGIAKHLQNVFDIQTLQTNGVIIGHDHRHNSHSFALTTAAVFLHAGIKVFLMPEIVPTPFVPWGIRKLNCVMGVMVTASHNPKQDNGFKVYWKNTAQIISPMDKEIQDLILTNLEPWCKYDISEASVLPRCQDVTQIVADSYFSRACQQCSFWTQQQKEHFSKSDNLIITYTAMHGVGTKQAQRAWKEFGLPGQMQCVEAQCSPDPDFKTIAFPNPEEAHALDLAMEHADRLGSKIVFANDPDADRFAVAEKIPKTGCWRVLTGNEIGLLFADWIWSHYKENNINDPEKCAKAVMIASTVSSKVLKRMAEKEHFLFDETLTGFKWMGNRGAERIASGYDFLFAYEVEIGFCCGDMSLDKDGIRGLGMFGQMTFQLAEQGKSLHDRIFELYSMYGFHCMANSYFFVENQSDMGKVFEGVQSLYKASLPFSIQSATSPTQNYVITDVRDLTTGYDSSTPDKLPLLPVDASAYMVTFTFDDKSVCTLRGSGTEPKLKYYVESVDSTPELAQARLKSLTDAVINSLLRPSSNNLRAP